MFPKVCGGGGHKTDAQCGVSTVILLCSDVYVGNVLVFLMSKHSYKIRTRRVQSCTSEKGVITRNVNAFLKRVKVISL